MKIINIENDTYLKEFKLYSFFQTQDWINIISSQKKYKNISKIFVFENNIKIYFPATERSFFGIKILNNTPLGGYGGFIFNQDIKNKQYYINKIIKYLKTKYSYISIIPYYCNSDTLLFLEKKSFNTIKVFTHILNINNINDLKHECYTKTFRYELKKGLNLKNIIVKEINTIDYFNLYKKNSQKWGKKIHLNKDFFKKLSTNRNVKTIAVFLNNKIIGASIFFIYNKKIFYWASYTNNKYKKHYPAKIIINVIQEQYLNKGFIFNCGSSLGLPGVQKFKESFGAQKINYNIYTYISPFLSFLLKLKSFLGKK